MQLAHTVAGEQILLFITRVHETILTPDTYQINIWFHDMIGLIAGVQHSRVHNHHKRYKIQTSRIGKNVLLCFVTFVVKASPLSSPLALSIGALALLPIPAAGVSGR